MECYYEVLGVEISSTEEDIRKAYKKLALLYHPDRNYGQQEEAKKKFQTVQEAYELLSDPQERAWYDQHRESLLRSGDDSGELGIDLSRFFSSSCFCGFEDEAENNFYQVYKDLFASIFEEDKKFSQLDVEYPPFGRSDSECGVWKEFYAFFESYSSPRTFSWLDKYDTRKAENRRISRLMEKENKKVKDAAKKERNALVRMLVQFVKKRDKRVKSYNDELKLKAKKNAEKTKEWREKQLEERDLILTNAQSSFAMDDLEEEIENIENLYSSEDEENGLFCVVCEVQFQNKKQKKKHGKSQNHLKTLGESYLENSVPIQSDDSVEKESTHWHCDICDIDIPNETKREEHVASKLHSKNSSEVLEAVKMSRSSNVKQAKNKRQKKKKQNDEEEKLTCNMCSATFESKNKLFSHIKELGHAIRK